ncbi:hypothetical protein PR202_gb12036 [Eleusine coracana subsp. coracana]|uniref:F-box/LRR-repeat protein 15/At3g58940/PEG3-like LRR domain-containing protein n=1 Tax=Eleusine coracana subsp. coracana TaxID=191504 RepID=A0AAV5EN78_ELECO|nr:hypothetical protein PR202_gb12036 [Eleusine coracana subsp. coracana]
MRPERNEEEVGAVPLPCFGNATTIDLNLGFLRLALPSSGAFARLAELGLKRVRFQGPLKLGDVVSSPRSPCLRILSVCDSFGVDSLTVHSKSLLRMELSSLNGLQELTIDAPALKELQLLYCFDQIQPVVDIAAPQLVSLYWNDACHRISVQLGNLGQLQLLSTNYILVYGPQCTRRHNHEIQWLLQRFQAIHSLDIMLFYGSVVSSHILAVVQLRGVYLGFMMLG